MCSALPAEVVAAAHSNQQGLKFTSVGVMSMVTGTRTSGPHRASVTHDPEGDSVVASRLANPPPQSNSSPSYER